MIEFYKPNISGLMGQENAGAQSRRKILSHATNERTAGHMPQWDSPKTALQKVEQTLTYAANGANSSSARLAYTGVQNAPKEADEFGFRDLVDIVNPLHHIPLVNIAYRAITGDEIKSSTQIIGGAIFGGPAGAAGGIVNAIIKEETGKDIGENAFAFVRNGETPQLRHLAQSSPEKRLNAANEDLENRLAYQDLPANLLGFADTGFAREKGFKAERHNDLPQQTVNTAPQPLGLYALAEAKTKSA